MSTFLCGTAWLELLRIALGGGVDCSRSGLLPGRLAQEPEPVQRDDELQGSSLRGCSAPLFEGSQGVLMVSEDLVVVGARFGVRADVDGHRSQFRDLVQQPVVSVRGDVVGCHKVEV